MTEYDNDLPSGYRWATEEECELIATGIDLAHIVVPRSHDSIGEPYVHGEADLAVPI